MQYIVVFLTNVYLLLRNLLVGLFRSSPDYVWLDIGGELPEFERKVGFLRKRLSPPREVQSLEGLRLKLRLAAADGRVSGVVLRIRALSAGWAALEELRTELSDYRRRGGRVVAYLIECGMGPYYLATAADEIVAAPLATVDVRGLRTNVNFIRDALERLGVEAEVVAVSPYKSAFDRFTRRDFSEESREQVERLLTARFSEFVSTVSAARGFTVGEVERLVDDAPYPARAALAVGLIDGVCYEDELPARLAGREDARDPVRLAEWGAARTSLKRSYLRRAEKKVGVVTLSGGIVRGRSRNVPIPVPLIGGEQAGDETIVAALRSAERNPRVGAVVFHVESGGGDALASDLVWREVERMKKKKPVVVLMGNVAASGGYYVGAAANRIVVRGNSVTGSIGVITLRPVATKLYEKLGVNPVSVERGAHAGLLDVSRPPTEEELSVIEGQIRAIYDEFISRVASGRGMDEARLREMAGGRVWTGREAVKLGLADEVGGFSLAVRRAAELADISLVGPESVEIVPPPKGVRPQPGEAAASVFEGGFGPVYRELADELLKTRTLAAMPYKLTDQSR
ncbi:signal peptide peptidase SppA [Rubrobacter indicoceani]|uniref:signal peptide peptidase SppA n=1 Tax=Rubrobacter indicoceani TaxID=2051957 RepID=UPI000E5BFA84|nr:signal peptide peptidase SppA [Rubrobacter indicoceani]